MNIKVIDDECVEVSDPASGWVARMADWGELVLECPAGTEIDKGVWLIGQQAGKALCEVLERLYIEHQKRIGEDDADSPHIVGLR